MAVTPEKLRAYDKLLDMLVEQLLDDPGAESETSRVEPKSHEGAAIPRQSKPGKVAPLDAQS